ncbi:MAG: superoxide dismutase family protein [bacterium]|nr:superoxide dismutase family protein [bacterium]
MFKDFKSVFINVLQRRPFAVAYVKGSEKYPALMGTVSFHQSMSGVLVVADICGLPQSEDECGRHIFAMHIHEGGECSGNDKDVFENAGQHYNPKKCRHPQHAGDLPPLFSANSCAWYAFLTDRFKIKDIIGKTVIVHEGVDDFSTDPSGMAGAKIACGVIKKY